MKILTTTELTVTKTVYTADYIESYSDGMPLSTSRYEYDSPEERLADLKKDYEDDEIDIDTSEDVQDIGWEFGTDTQTITTTVEVVENDDGTIIVRQKEQLILSFLQPGIDKMSGFFYIMNITERLIWLR